MAALQGIREAGEAGEGINLDAHTIDPDELAHLAFVLGGYAGCVRYAPSVARVLFPRRPRRYVATTADLAHYAWNKQAAMRCRLAGEIARAIVYETICDRIYDRLPEYARW